MSWGDGDMGGRCSGTSWSDGDMGDGARGQAGAMTGWPSVACPGCGAEREPVGSVWAPAALQMARDWQALLGHSGFSARKRWGRTVSSPGRPLQPPAAGSRGWPWGAVGCSVPRPTGGSAERALSLPHQAIAWVTHTGPRARRRRSGGGAVGCSRPPRLAPQEPFGPGDQLSAAAAAPALAGSPR